MTLRAALLLCGQPRTMEFCFPSFKRHIMDVYHPDIFLVTDEQLERASELYQPVRAEAFSQETIDEQVRELRSAYVEPEVGHGFPRSFSIAWKTYRASLLRQAYEREQNIQYDVVLLTRFDVRFRRIQPITMPEANTLYVPKKGAYWTYPPDKPGIHWHGYSAHLAWGTPAVMDAVAGMYFEGADNLQLAYEASQEWGRVPEHVLKNFCDRNGIRASFTDIDMMLIRGTSEKPLAFDHKPLDAYPGYR